MDGIVNPPGDCETYGKHRSLRKASAGFEFRDNYTRHPNNLAEKIAYIRYLYIDIETN